MHGRTRAQGRTLARLTLFLHATILAGTALTLSRCSNDSQENAPPVSPDPSGSADPGSLGPGGSAGAAPGNTAEPSSPGGAPPNPPMDDPAGMGGGENGGSENGPAPTAPMPTPPKPDAGMGGSGADPLPPQWDWNGVIGTGQSLAVGSQIGDNIHPAVTTTQAFSNLKLSLGNETVPPFNPMSAELSLVPLVEPIRGSSRGYPHPYPINIYGETPHTAMANQMSALAEDAVGAYISVHSVVGESGQPMQVIGKGAQDQGDRGRAYAATLFEVAAIKRLADEAQKTYGIAAITLTHGEADVDNQGYGSEMETLWSNYNTDLKQLTAQTRDVQMFVSQQNTLPKGNGSRSASTLAQWRVGVDNPGNIICSGPKYQYRHVNDALHLTGESYAEHGEKLAQIYFQRIVLGEDWQPLQPLQVERDGRIVRVQFHVPTPPLVWDETLPVSGIQNWTNGRGFELRTGNNAVPIESVAIAGDSVEITAGQDLPAQGLIVGYAMTAQPARPGGTVRWGQLSDSDPFVGFNTNTPQRNYAVAFELPVQ